MRFILENPDDIIQKCLKDGYWYEQGYLDLMSHYIINKATIIDVGAYVGNHTVYFSKKLNAKTIYAIEPIPYSYKMLLCNIALNYCHNVNVDYIGLALADTDRIGYPFTIYGKNNLGSTRLFKEKDPTGFIEDYKNYYNEEPLQYDPVKMVSGDSLFFDKDVDFIKIDVEGLEHLVLEGFKKTINRCRPSIFVEVMLINREYFDKWLIDNRYVIVFDTIEQSKKFYHDDDLYAAANFMIIPEEKK